MHVEGTCLPSAPSSLVEQRRSCLCACVPPHSSRFARAALRICHIAYQAFSLQLAQPLTSHSGSACREGFVLRCYAVTPQGKSVVGVGEVAPLPGQK